MMRSRFRSRRSVKGFVTIEFVGGVAFLIFPTVLLVLTIPTWYERADTANVASREAARTYVLTGSQVQAEAAVETIRQNSDLKDSDVHLKSLVGNPAQRGATVTAVAETTIPLVHLPIFNADVGDITIARSHNEQVDLFRSQVP